MSNQKLSDLRGLLRPGQVAATWQEVSLSADAEAIRAILESSIQRNGAGNLAKALAAAGASENLQTLAEYSQPEGASAMDEAQLADRLKAAGYKPEPEGFLWVFSTSDLLDVLSVLGTESAS